LGSGIVADKTTKTPFRDFNFAGRVGEAAEAGLLVYPMQGA